MTNDLKPTLNLPSYLDQSKAVKDRFTRLKEREVILEVKNLNKIYTTAKGELVALKNVNFKTHRREFVCVIGPSGCGKSTLIRILAGLESHSSGDVLLDNKPVIGPGRDRGMVFQSYTLFPWRTVKKNVMFGLEMNGITGEEASNEADLWLELVGLKKFANAYPHELSGGMKQRVAIARALVNRPAIILADEPTGNLDSKTSIEIMGLFEEIHKRGNTVILVTHEPDIALHAHRIVRLRDGLIESDTMNSKITTVSEAMKHLPQQV